MHHHSHLSTNYCLKEIVHVQENKSVRALQYNTPNHLDKFLNLHSPRCTQESIWLAHHHIYKVRPHC